MEALPDVYRSEHKLGGIKNFAKRVQHLVSPRMIWVQIVAVTPQRRQIKNISHSRARPIVRSTPCLGLRETPSSAVQLGQIRRLNHGTPICIGISFRCRCAPHHCCKPLLNFELSDRVGCCVGVHCCFCHQRLLYGPGSLGTSPCAGSRSSLFSSRHASARRLDELEFQYAGQHGLLRLFRLLC